MNKTKQIQQVLEKNFSLQTTFGLEEKVNIQVEENPATQNYQVTFFKPLFSEEAAPEIKGSFLLPHQTAQTLLEDKNWSRLALSAVADGDQHSYQLSLVYDLKVVM
jgi:hypothetical protein